MNQPTITLNNGVRIPQVGLGVWQAEEGAEVENAVRAALECGYRLIDTAAIYGNEAGVGKGIKASGVPREEIFITTKVWNSHHAYDRVMAAFDESLEKLDCDGYVDLYLIHWPVPMGGLYPEAWSALEQIYRDGRARAIGVSNFKVPHLEKLREESEMVPAVNQIELHPMFAEKEIRDYCEPRGIKIESYSPLMRGRDVLENPVIAGLAEKHGKTPAQVVLRWHVQNGFIVIPKSVHAERIQQNFNLFDFELVDDDMQQIDGLDAGIRLSADPDVADWR